MQKRSIVIDAIVIDDGRLPVVDETVAALAESMDRIGLLNPITVRPVFHVPRLVAGRHRLEAAKRLGWTEIDCVELDERSDDPQAETIGQIAEIDENLVRRAISEIERAEMIARRVEILANKLAQAAPVSERGRVEGRGNAGGIRAAARELNMPRDTVRRAVSIAKLSPEAKAAARETGLDTNQSALLSAAKRPTAGEQVAEVRARAAGMEVPVAEIQARVRLAAAWEAASPDDRKWFVAEFIGGEV